MSEFTESNRSPILKPIFGAVTGIGASSTATVKLPPGLTYDTLCVYCTIAGTAATRAELEAMLGTIRLTVSGVEKFSVTAKQLIAVTEFHATGAIGDTGVLVIPFSRLWMQGAVAQLGPNYGTDRESSVVLEIGQEAGSTIDAMAVYARLNPLAEGLGAHTILRRFTFNVAATGKYLYPDLPIIPGEFLSALHIQVPVVANLTNIAYITDDVRMVDIKPAVLHQLYKLSNPVRTPQTAKLFVTLDFQARGFDADAVNVGLLKSQVLELEFANAAPNAVTVIGEYQVSK